MARAPLVHGILRFVDDHTLMINGIGRPKRIELPSEVVEWLANSYPARRVLEELITHYRFRTRLAHPGALRSLLLLLYARSHNLPPYKVARRYGVAPEQLYRLERGLKKDGLHDFVMNVLRMESPR